MNRPNKRRLWQYWQQCNTNPAETPALTRMHVHDDASWHGPVPIDRLHGVEEVNGSWWGPLVAAIPDLQRRPYLLIEGSFEGGDWVCATGDFVGTFASDWLGVPATRRSVHFRFGEFCRFEDGLIVEVRMLVDLLELIEQAGFELLPGFPGRRLWVPGPLAGGGVSLEARDPAASKKTLALIEAMIFGGLNSYDGSDQGSQRLERYWHPHMVWHGPVGVGSAYGLDEFKRNAQGPIVAAFPDRKGVGHRVRIAEGAFAASTGWPSLVGTHRTTYLDWPPTGEKVGWNIMDFWRRDGGLLLENWVLIDMIGAAKASGIDLLEKLKRKIEERSSRGS